MYAVVRFHPAREDPEFAITVKEVVRSREIAEAEVARLNALNADKGARYFCQITRLFGPGESAGEVTAGE